MKIVITGGTGFIGRKLAQRLLERGYVVGPDGGKEKIESLLLADLFAPEPAFPEDPRLQVRTGDFSSREAIAELIDTDTGLVFHLAAVVSGGAEEDFELGMRVNLHGSMHLLEALRGLDSCPRLVFASSVAAFGGNLPEVIPDTQILNPQTSYGVQKTAVELLINDYSRRGFVDGRALRLPTIVVRPGKPNKALSSFASSIVREPLQGQEVICPVGEDTEMWVLSPRRVVDAFIHAAELPAADWGDSRALSLPGITVSVRDAVETLRELGGEAVVNRIRWQADAQVEKVVYGWPRRFDPQRALQLGFRPDDNMREIVQAFIDDELAGEIVS